MAQRLMSLWERKKEKRKKKKKKWYGGMKSAE